MRPTSTCVALLLVLAATGNHLAAVDTTRLPSDPPKDWKYCDPYTLRTVAGVAQPATAWATWTSSGDEGPASQAKIGDCGGVATGPDGSIYFCATKSHAVRKITPDGIVHRIAGQYDQQADYANPASIGDGGSALSARLDHPFSLAVDAAGNVYILDYARLRKITPDGVIHTLAGSTLSTRAWLQTPSSAEVAAAMADFRYTGPATNARLWTVYLDLSLFGTMAVAHDGTVYLHSDLGIRRIDSTGRISPLIEGGSWGYAPPGTTNNVGFYRFIDIAIDSHDTLFANGGPNTLGMVTLYTAPNVYRFSAAGDVTRVLGSDNGWGPISDPDGWNVGPVDAGKSFDIQGLHFDASDRMWFQPNSDGPHFCHLDSDGVVRWSGSFQTHSTFNTNIVASGGPAPLNFRTYAATTRTSSLMPNGDWVRSEVVEDQADTSNRYPVIRVFNHTAPTISPTLTLSTTSASVSAAFGAARSTIAVTATNTGTLFGELGFTSDQPWLQVFDQPAMTFPNSQGKLPFAVGAQYPVSIYAYPSGVAQPGDYTGHVYVHLLGTKTAPQVITVVMHVGAGTGANVAPFITSDHLHPYRVVEDGVLTIPLTAVDDGLPNPPHALTWTLTTLPKHGTASISHGAFGDVLTYQPPANFNTAQAINPNHFPEIIRVQVSDGALSASANDISITVDSINDAPVVNAGPDQTLTFPASATLNGSAQDIDSVCDATGVLVPQHLELRWSKVSGPGMVTFSAPTSLSTSAAFSVAGSYVLSLSANDSVVTVSDTVTINLPYKPGPTLPPTPEGTGTGTGTVSGGSAGSGTSAGSGGKGCGMGSGIALLGLLGLIGLGARRGRRG